MADSSIETTVEAHIHQEHADVCSAIEVCADAVAETWSTPSVTGGRAIVDPFRTRLERTGVLERLPGVLADLVVTAGYRLSAPPAPAPPYVVVTSRGVLLRATIEPGRLVVELEAFELDPERHTYSRRDGLAVSASLR
ncbi:hypothetical protein OB919_00830 [Halobacteria archaeon AArc-curdl1]|uniref:DUF7988 domain-containing protein n=1 Tax=Natronosalvus hydrolyticus TaxID=2979988 RepID=A0AAP3E521_9EURY|nr:hypothetical protein [Halobacteria archaeon AArc-curdl1]